MKYFFLAENRAETAPLGATGLSVFQRSWESEHRTRKMSTNRIPILGPDGCCLLGNLSEKYASRHTERLQVGLLHATKA